MPNYPIRYINKYRTRHGKEAIYYRPPGQKKKKLRGPVGSPEFWEDYIAAQNADPARQSIKPIERGSLRWLINQYKKSAHWRSEVGERTRYVRGLQYDKFSQQYGHYAVKNLRQKHLYAIQDRHSDTPAEINNIFKALKPVFKFAVRNDIITHNPFTGLEKLKSKNPDGFRAWTDAEMEQFTNRWPIGTRERLAYELIRHTGQRRSDVHVLGKQHEKAGWLSFTQFKGRHSKPQHMQIPIFDELRKIIDASPTGDLTYLVTQYGRPFKTAESFGTWFAKSVKRAGLSGISAHGLRKTFASKQAENESTTNEIAALGGWSDLQQVELYTKSAERKKMAKNVVERQKKPPKRKTKSEQK